MISVLGKQKQEDGYKFEASLVYAVVPGQLGVCNKIVLLSTPPKVIVAVILKCSHCARH